MAKIDTTSETDTPAAAPEPVRISLDEFCRRLSERVKRPELIGAFHSTEKAAGRLVGTSEEFAHRYEDFINKPV